MGFDGLTDEQREKAKECKSTEELQELEHEEGCEHSTEELESVAGGGVFRCSEFLKH